MLLRSYTSMASTSADRSRAQALITFSMAVGGSLGGLLAVWFASFDSSSISLMSNLGGSAFLMHINPYTAPAIATGIVNTASGLLFVVLFVERYAGIAKKQNVS